MSRRLTRAFVALVLTGFALGANAADRAAPDSSRPESSLVIVALHADSAGIDTLATGPAAKALLAPRPTEQAPEPAAPPASVPVFLGGSEIFRVRTALQEADPAARAAAIRARLARAVADVHVSADSVRLVSTADGVRVTLGPTFLWLISPGDVEGMGAGELAGLLGGLPDRIRDGVERERASRRPTRVLLSLALAALYTIVALLLARALVALSRRWRRVLEERLPALVGEVRVRGFQLLSRRHLRAAASFVARIDVIGGALLAYAWLAAVFALFPWTQGWSWWLLHFGRTQISQAVVSVANAIPGLLMIVVIFLVFRWLTRASGRFFDAIASGSLVLRGFHPELAPPSKRLARILLWIVALMLAYPYIPGAQTRAVQGVSVLLGVMVSLGSTGVVGNAIAGVVLTYSRAFRAGDRVKLGEHVGDVVSLGFFATKLRTLRNEEVTLPNGQIASGAVLNYSRLAEDPGLILHTQVTIGYDSDWRQVHALLIEAAGHVEGIAAEPVPWVYQRALDDNYVSYEICAITHHPQDQLALYSRLHEQIQDAFARAGVEILSPAYHALRDGNATVLPAEPKGPRAEPGGFRVRPGSG